ncbi:hypothetical protein J3454_07455 [Erythrobacter sp. NFXS35]|uniref:hypothetical protein n=1 Tax=Erythrobacter sp. NFXS35 TaxID=2818436 RepID=UPI0032DE3441
MAMQDKTGPLIVLRTLAAILFILALGMLGGRIFGGLDISPAIIVSQITMGIALLVIAQSTLKSGGKPD